VDGGDADQIRRLLFPVIEEEVEKGNNPDIVVVLTGSNDLKRIIQSSDAGTRASVRGFRGNLIRLVKEIHGISPTTRVILPALPTYRLDTNSILNIFPLSLFLDGMIGFWDAQKKIVADMCSGVMHVDLKFKDVYKWYIEESNKENEDPTLIAADGIHPNEKCYGKWGEFVGNTIVDRVEAAQKRGPSSQSRHAFHPKRLGWQWNLNRKFSP
jgi:lysophospholipase L1-like esterase